jgi:predicted transcriptional regulator
MIYFSVIITNQNEEVQQLAIEEIRSIELEKKMERVNEEKKKRKESWRQYRLGEIQNSLPYYKKNVTTLLSEYKELTGEDYQDD